MTRAPTPEGPIKISVFARWYGVDPQTVKDRITAGALPSSAGFVNGRRMILDAARAVEEWEANTRPYANGHDRGEPVAPGKLAAATLRERNARAAVKELEYAEKSREVAPVAEMERRWLAVAVQVRTGLLGLPTRARQRLPHLTAADVAELDRLVREVLEEFAERVEGKGADG